MPRYFFDVHDGIDVADQDGTELPDIDEAKVEAAMFAASLLRDDPKRFWSGHEWTVRVRDEESRQLFEITFLAKDASARASAETSASPI